MPVHEDGAVSRREGRRARSAASWSLDPSGTGRRARVVSRGGRSQVRRRPGRRRASVALWWTRRGRRGAPGSSSACRTVRRSRPSASAAPERPSPAPTRGEVYHWELGETATLTDVSPRQRLADHRARVHHREQHLHRRHRATAHVSAWFRAPVGADGNLAHGAGVGVRAAGRGHHRDRRIDPRPHVCDRRRRRPGRPAPSDVGPDARVAAGHDRRCSGLVHDTPERRRCSSARPAARSIGSRWPIRIPKIELAYAVRQGLVRGLRASRSTSGSRPERPTTSSRRSASCRSSSARSRARSTR